MVGRIAEILLGPDEETLTVIQFFQVASERHQTLGMPVLIERFGEAEYLIISCMVRPGLTFTYHQNNKCVIEHLIQHQRTA